MNQDSLLSAYSSFAASVAYSAAHTSSWDWMDFIGKIIVPLIIGIVYPLAKDWLTAVIRRNKY